MARQPRAECLARRAPGDYGDRAERFSQHQPEEPTWADQGFDDPLTVPLRVRHPRHFLPGRGRRTFLMRRLSLARVAAGGCRLPSRGPHGSGRAELPHPALRDTDSLRGVSLPRFRGHLRCDGRWSPWREREGRSRKSTRPKWRSGLGRYTEWGLRAGGRSSPPQPKGRWTEPN